MCGTCRQSIYFVNLTYTVIDLLKIWERSFIGDTLLWKIKIFVNINKNIIYQRLSVDACWALVFSQTVI